MLRKTIEKITLLDGTIYQLKPHEKVIFEHLPDWFTEEDYQLAQKIFAGIMTIRHLSVREKSATGVDNSEEWGWLLTYPSKININSDFNKSEEWKLARLILENFVRTWWTNEVGRAIFRALKISLPGVNIIHFLLHCLVVVANSN